MKHLPDQETKFTSENTSNTTRRSLTDPLSPLPLTRVIILTLISRFPHITGYTLMKKKVPENLHPDISLKTGTVYSELRRLERSGKLMSEQDKSGRKERYYTITNAGQKELAQLSKQIQNRRNFVLNPLLKIIFEDLLSSDD
ncbi:MAG: PadR family transcriptional regulator [Candidatus Lokiarchaeota archaeon]|nr:PadR family transcriptional regulator [Candidatus Lokiarchaeota archaeon]